MYGRPYLVYACTCILYLVIYYDLAHKLKFTVVSPPSFTSYTAVMLTTLRLIINLDLTTQTQTATQQRRQTGRKSKEATC